MRTRKKSLLSDSGRAVGNVALEDPSVDATTATAPTSFHIAAAVGKENMNAPLAASKSSGPPPLKRFRAQAATRKIKVHSVIQKKDAKTANSGAILRQPPSTKRATPASTATATSIVTSKNDSVAESTAITISKDDDSAKLLGYKCGIIDAAETAAIIKGLDRGVGLIMHRGKKIYLEFYRQVEHGEWLGLPCLLSDGKVIVTTDNYHQVMKIAYETFLEYAVRNSMVSEIATFSNILNMYLDIDAMLFLDRSQWWEKRSIDDKVRLVDAKQQQNKQVIQSHQDEGEVDDTEAVEV